MNCYYQVRFRCPFYDVSGMEKLCCECVYYNEGNPCIPYIAEEVKRNRIQTKENAPLDKFMNLHCKRKGYKLIIPKHRKGIR
jgi:hypothetical protein